MKCWNVEIKEKGNPHVIKTSLIGDHDRRYCIEFFGLENDDVEWYHLTCEE